MNNLPTVAHLVSLHTVGGVENFFCNFVSTTSNDFDHHVFMSNDEIHPFYVEKLKAARIKTHCLRKYKGIYLPRIPSILRLKNIENVCNNNLITSLIVWNKLDNFPTCFPSSLKKIHFERGSAWLANNNPSIGKYLNECHEILSNSEAGFHLLKERWGTNLSSSSRPTYNGVNPLYTSEIPQANKLNKKIILGFAGRLVPLKGWILALQTLKELIRQNPNGYELVIAGDGRHKDLMLKLIQDWKLSHSVRYLGLVKDMRDFFYQINILLHTSIREPQGNIALESQALGRPVIGGMVDGNPEVIRNKETGILIDATIDPNTYDLFAPALSNLPPFVLNPISKKLTTPLAMDPLLIADSVRSIVDSHTRFNQMSRNATSWVRNEFEFEKRKKNLVNRILEIII